MNETHHPTDTAVFVDQSGRRRRILMIIGVLGGVMMLAVAGILVGGAFTSTSLSVIGWPGGDQPDEAPAVIESERASRSAKPAVRPTARPSTPMASRTPTPTPVRTPTPNRTSTPAAKRTTARPTPTPTRATTPAAATPKATESERTPPGQTKQPPGNPNKTHGPKS